MKVFGVSSNLQTPEQAEEAVVKENMLERSPRIFMKPGEKRTERLETLMKAVSVAK